ncbi:MAG: FAD-dependent oxidoreductase [Aestuariivita sp.]|nr:FAD-dependent oxidoreductase [Aestuariivita sp.]
MSLPSSSKIIIIGGGIIGCSTAYHLAHMGQEVLLLEKAALTSGSTWHAAGLVGQLRSNSNITQLLGYSIELYARLQEETGLSTGWKMNGGLRLACNKERWTEVKRQATSARSFGLDMQLLTPQEAQDLWPLMDIGDVLGAAFLPTDGHASPSDISQALVRGARNGGVKVLENCPVVEILTDKGKLVGVRTAQGDVNCEKLVLCCGQWTRDLAATVGVNVPLVSIEHQYMITESFDVPTNLPTLRDPDRLTYYKEEVGGMVMGGYEPNGILWAEKGIPDRFDFQLLQSNFDHFEQLIDLALPRVPRLREVGIKQLLNGPESFTPDGNFIIGEAPEKANIFVGAGFNAFGIAAGGGSGMALAEWVVNGGPPYDLWSADIRRFGRPHTDIDWLRTRTLEAYCKHYAIAWPFEEYESGRPCRRSPLYRSLKDAGAVFGEKLGWERPNWYAEEGEDAFDIYTFEYPNWQSAVAREHKAAREAVVLFDQTSFAKYLLTGPNAEDALQWIASNRVDKTIGSIIYTQMLNDNGGIECDLTCVRTNQDEYYIVTGTGFATHDFDWIKRNIPEGMKAQLVDVTSSNAVLSLFGPKSREVLQTVSNCDVSDMAHPFGRAQKIGIAGCPVLALRITYVGELGWELHMPVEYAQTVYEKLQEAGVTHGLRNAGYRAIETLRLEKGYRAWSSDIGPDHTPDEAGLGWAVKMQSNIPFKGRDAVASQRLQGVKKIMTTFTTNGDAVLCGRETIYRNGERCGWLSSAGYGFTIGKSIGMGFVRSETSIDSDYVMIGKYKLEVAGKLVNAEVTLDPLYDPKSKKVKA